MRPFHDLVAWQLGHALALDVWRLTHGFPREEQWVLVPQMRRAALSVPGNLSEGCGLETLPQLHRHVVIASGSASHIAVEPAKSVNRNATVPLGLDHAAQPVLGRVQRHQSDLRVLREQVDLGAARRVDSGVVGDEPDPAAPHQMERVGEWNTM